MHRMLTYAALLTARFARNRDGVAAVEFALIMPMMILLYFGTVDASRAISFDRHLTSVSASLGDLVSQTKGDLTSGELNDLFEAAKITMMPYDAAGVKQVVSCVHVDDDGKATVRWSVAYNGGDARDKGDDLNLPKEFTDIATDSYVIVSEASMTYHPITDIAFNSGIPLYKQFYYVPRFGDEITLDGEG